MCSAGVEYYVDRKRLREWRRKAENKETTGDPKQIPQ